MSENIEQRSTEEQALLDAAAAGAVLLTPVETVIDTPAITPAPPAVLLFEYQPKDESGRPIGGKQVIKYTDASELPNLLVAQNELLIRKLREETRKNRLGIQDKDEIADDSQRFEAPIEFKPRTLSAEERYQIARDINDPETFDAAADALLEARLGAKPEVFGKTLSDLQVESLRNRAVAESEAFMASNPDYIRCNENGQAITSWLVRYDLAPVKANYQRAYEALKSAGVLVVTPEITPEPTPVPVVPVAEAVVIDPPKQEDEPPTTRPVVSPSRIPTGLTRGQTTDVGTSTSVGDDIIYEIPLPQGGKKRYTGAAALNAMPSDEYKHRLLHEKGFREKAEKLEQVQVANRKFVRR